MMLVLIPLLAVLLAIWGLRRRASAKRLPALTHDYSEQRAVYQRFPGQRKRRFK